MRPILFNRPKHDLPQVSFYRKDNESDNYLKDKFGYGAAPNLKGSSRHRLNKLYKDDDGEQGKDAAYQAVPAA
jgi:hypothetical protein